MASWNPAMARASVSFKFLMGPEFYTDCSAMTPSPWKHHKHPKATTEDTQEAAPEDSTTP